MTLREYCLWQIGISGITSKSIDKDGLGQATFITARLMNGTLDLLFEVQSSHDDNKHVNGYGQAQPFLKRGYTVTIAFDGVDKIVPDNWLASGEQQATQYLQQIISRADARVNCDCPAFYWQGMWEGDDKKKTDYMKFFGTHGKGVWNARHADSGANIGQQMCKHIYAATNAIPRCYKSILEKLGAKLTESFLESYIAAISS